ncbi:hypothetical protein KCP75_11550 [Salmonella enterica subsp. enterica]|nr:hypothetical protein KCP75_11550 [Salmonella enterica subsp. enterica]
MEINTFAISSARFLRPSSALLLILRLQPRFALPDALVSDAAAWVTPPMLMTRRLPPFWLYQPTPRWLMPPRGFCGRAVPARFRRCCG